MKPEAINVIKMLSKPVSQRMPFEGVELTKFIQKIPFFKQYFSIHSQGFVSMCLGCTLQKYRPGQDLYERQLTPQFIYVVIDGVVELTQIKNTGALTKRVISGYSVLGNVQVVFNLDRRGEQAVAKSEVFCMVIDQANFQNIWEKGQEIKKAYQYLKTNAYFQQLSEYELQKLSLMMNKKAFTKGQIILKEGETTESVMYIIYGQIQVVKKLNFDGKQKKVVVEVLEEMSSYGEYEVHQNHANQTTLVAISSGTYYSVFLKEAYENNKGYLQILKHYSLPYPDREELQFRLAVQQKIEKEKKKVKRILFS